MEGAILFVQCLLTLSCSQLDHVWSSAFSLLFLRNKLELELQTRLVHRLRAALA